MKNAGLHIKAVEAAFTSIEFVVSDILQHREPVYLSVHFESDCSIRLYSSTVHATKYLLERMEFDAGIRTDDWHCAVDCRLKGDETHPCIFTRETLV